MDYRDAMSYEYDSENEFLRHLKEMTVDEAVWDQVNINEAKFIPIAEMTTDIMDFHQLGVYGDTNDNMRLYVDLPGIGKTAVGIGAFPSILKRAKLAGASLLRVENAFLAEMLNKCFELYKEPMLVYRSCEKVRAMASKNYCPIDMCSIFRASSRHLSQEFEQVDWQFGYLDHTKAMVQYEIKDDFLTAEYNKLLGTKDCTAVVKVVSSNTTRHGANIHYGIISGSRQLVFQNCLRLEHSDKAILDHFIKNVQDTFAQFTAEYANLEKMKKIILRHPNNALYEALSSLGISKRIISNTVELRKAMYGDKPCSILDLYMDACEAINIAKRGGYTTAQLHKLSETIAKLCHEDWFEFDHAPKAEVVAPVAPAKKAA